MPYIANPLEGLPIRNSFITDQANLGTTPATDDTLIIYDISATALKQLTIANLQASLLVSPAFTGTPTAPTANAGTDTTQLATTAFVTAAVAGENQISEMNDVTISSNSSGEILKWNGSAWINNTLAEAGIAPVATPTFTTSITIGSAAMTEADLEQLDGITAGTAAASKALVLDANLDIGTIRNLTINGVFTDGNYTFDTSGNVSGLGTIGSGAITSSSTVQGTTITATTAFVPDASGGADLGTTALEFNDAFFNDGAVINFGDDQDVTLTHVADAGLLLNSDNYITFRDSALKVYSSADGQLDIDADTEVEITATTVDLNGNLDVSGTYTGGGLMTTGGNIVIPDAGSIGSASDTNAVTISSGGVVAVTATTANTSATDGALTVAGGAGVAADLSVGDDVRLISDSAVLSFGADSDTTLTHTDGTGLTLNSTNKLTFGDTGTFIHQSSDGVLTIESDTTVDINGAVALNGAVTGATNITLSGELDAATGDFSGAVDIGGTLTLSGGDMDASDQNIANIKTATFVDEHDNSSSGTSDTIDWREGLKQKTTMTGNCTYSFTAPAGPCNLILTCYQDGTVRTITWPSNVKWPGGTAPTFTGTNNIRDIVAFYYDGTDYFGQATLNYPAT